MENSSIKLTIHPLPPIIIGLALVICAFVVRSTVIEVKGYGRAIQVTGSAVKPITSDFAIWEANIQASSLDLAIGYAKVKRDLDLLKAFMKENGFDEKSYEIGPVQVNRSYDREGKPTQFILSQPIKLQLADVPRITELGKKASVLIEKGVELGMQNIRYTYSKLEDVKIEMIKAATENAKLRAEQLAGTAGKKVGAPTSARVGVFQIRPVHSQEVSDYGMNDVTSIEKEVVCTVNIGFLVD
jgi:uncharacterized protein